MVSTSGFDAGLMRSMQIPEIVSDLTMWLVSVAAGKGDSNIIINHLPPVLAVVHTTLTHL